MSQITRKSSGHSDGAANMNPASTTACPKKLDFSKAILPAWQKTQASHGKWEAELKILITNLKSDVEFINTLPDGPAKRKLQKRNDKTQRILNKHAKVKHSEVLNAAAVIDTLQKESPIDNANAAELLAVLLQVINDAGPDARTQTVLSRLTRHMSTSHDVLKDDDNLEEEAEANSPQQQPTISASVTEKKSTPLPETTPTLAPVVKPKLAKPREHSVFMPNFKAMKAKIRTVKVSVKQGQPQKDKAKPVEQTPPTDSTTISSYTVARPKAIKPQKGVAVPSTGRFSLNALKSFEDRQADNAAAKVRRNSQEVFTAQARDGDERQGVSSGGSVPVKDCGRTSSSSSLNKRNRSEDDAGRQIFKKPALEGRHIASLKTRRAAPMVHGDVMDADSIAIRPVTVATYPPYISVFHHPRMSLEDVHPVDDDEEL